MRTTLDLNAALLRNAKEQALKERQPLRAVVEDALRRCLSPSPAKPFRVKWEPPVRGKIQPGINPSDLSGLLNLMDGLEGFR